MTIESVILIAIACTFSTMIMVMLTDLWLSGVFSYHLREWIEKRLFNNE